MAHHMKLNPEPFFKIQNGTKTIELRLYDEKRQKIKTGDRIVFTNTETAETIEANVKDIFVFDSFDELYSALPLTECGYSESEATLLRMICLTTIQKTSSGGTVCAV